MDLLPCWLAVGSELSYLPTMVMICMSTYRHRLLVLLYTVLIVVGILWPTYFVYDMKWFSILILDGPIYSGSFFLMTMIPCLFDIGECYIAFLPIALVDLLRSLAQ